MGDREREREREREFCLHTHTPLKGWCEKFTGVHVRNGAWASNLNAKKCSPSPPSFFFAYAWKVEQG